MSTQTKLRQEPQRQEAHELPPQIVFSQMLTGYWVSQGLYVAARLGIADLMADGAKTSDELAARCSVHAPSLYRVLRMLAGCGVFTEDPAGRFSLTPLGAMLQSAPGSMRAMTIHLLEDTSWQAWGKLLDNVRTGETAFTLAHGEEVFPYYARHPESSEPFNRAMTEYSAAVVAEVTRRYDFSDFGKIVDVGGGHGALLSAILAANPRARGVLFDLPSTIEDAKHQLASAGVAARCETAGGDFFTTDVPAGGDAYILKHIIHDWDEERALAILRNVRSTMADHGRLLLIETVVPESGEASVSKLMDVHMMVMTGGRERTAAEYAVLLTDAGFKLTRVVPTEMMVSVVEAVKV